MTPKLFEYNETSFESFGLCLLTDAIKCEVIEERNGKFELYMEYPLGGKGYDEITAERIIGAVTRDGGNVQGFRIYRIEKTLEGRIGVYAAHVSYDLSGHIVEPFGEGNFSALTMMEELFDGTAFMAVSNIQLSKTVNQSVPATARALLIGQEGSVLDLFGGEFEFNNFVVSLNTARGADNGVVVEYGKNITALNDNNSTEDTYNSIVAYATYWNDEDEPVTVMSDTRPVQSQLVTGKTLLVDLSYGFEMGDVPTVARLNALADQYAANNSIGAIVSDTSVSFVPFWYDSANVDEQLHLCDTVTIRDSRLNIDKKMKVVSMTYDVLAEVFTKVTCGKIGNSIVSTIAATAMTAGSAEAAASQMPKGLSKYVLAATRLITGNSGGYVLIHENADGKPYEILVMDTESISTAQKIWRWNLNGLGYSGTGYDGPYSYAMTMDGKFNADFIRAGRLLVTDADDNVLFDANVAGKSIMLGGFTAQVSSQGTYLYGSGESETYRPGYKDAYQIRVRGYSSDIEALGTIWEKKADQSGWFQNKRNVNIDSSSIHMVSRGKQYDPTGSGADEITSIEAGGITLTKETAASGTEYVNLLADRLSMNDGNGKSITISPSGPVVMDDYSSTDAQVASGSVTTIASFQINPGTYIITATARFDSNATGIRQFSVTGNNSATTNINREFTVFSNATAGNIRTTLNLYGIQKIENRRTLNLNVYQNSGATLGVVWAWHYVRLV